MFCYLIFRSLNHCLRLQLLGEVLEIVWVLLNRPIRKFSRFIIFWSWIRLFPWKRRWIVFTWFLQADANCMKYSKANMISGHFNRHVA